MNTPEMNVIKIDLSQFEKLISDMTKASEDASEKKEKKDHSPELNLLRAIYGGPRISRAQVHDSECSCPHNLCDEDIDDEEYDEDDEYNEDIDELENEDRDIDYIFASGEDQMQILIAVPGCGKDDVSVSMTKGIHDNTLHIIAAAQLPLYDHLNIQHDSIKKDIERDISVPLDVDPRSITATCENGLLSIYLKRRAVKPFEIKIM